MRTTDWQARTADRSTDWIGRYKILRMLGAGGMGQVFLAYDERLDRHVAIKSLLDHRSVSSEARERFRREARLIAKLNHPNVVHIYDVLDGSDSQADSIVMEYIDGESLRQKLDRKDVSLAAMVALGRQIADGMSAAHDSGVVHRDLKSENVLVSNSGIAKIVDFGIAKSTDAPPLTADSAVIGTFRAMSPEQASGRALDHRSDLFSFGVLLYEALAWQTPFAAPSPLAVMARIVGEPHAPITSHNPHVPERLAALIDQLLAKNPSLRPRDFIEVEAVLAEISALVEPDAAMAGSAARRRASSWDLDPTQDAAPQAASRPSSAGLVPARAVSEAEQAATVSLHAEKQPQAEPLPSGARAPEGAGAPARRRRLAAVAGAVLLTACGTAVYLGVRTQAKDQPGAPRAAIYVAVPMPGTGGTDVADLDTRAVNLRMSLIRALTELDGVLVQAPGDVDRIAEAVPTTAALAQALAADEVLSSTLTCDAVECMVQVERIRGRDSAMVWSDSLRLPSEDYYQFALAVRARVRSGYADFQPRPGKPALEVSAEDYKAYVRLYRSYTYTQDMPDAEIGAALAAIRQRSPAFVDAYLLEARVAQQLYHLSRQASEIDRAFQLIAMARKLEPNALEPLHELFFTELAAGRFDGADKTLSALATAGLDVVSQWTLRAALAWSRGDSEGALALLRRAAERQPSATVLFTLGNYAFQAGHQDEALARLTEVLGRVPEHAGARAVLAGLELKRGNAARAVELYALLAEHTANFATLSNLGIAYLLAGKFDRAHETLQRAMEMQPDSPLSYFNLGDAAWLLGQSERALLLYRQALTKLESDPQADTWPLLSVKAQALAHLGQSASAIAAIQRALAQAPENGDLAYAAAVVYSAVGDNASALVFIEKARKDGYGPAWFSFRWFAAMQGQPAFTALMKE